MPIDKEARQVNIVDAVRDTILGSMPCCTPFSEMERTLRDRAYYLECSEIRAADLGVKAGLGSFLR